MASAMTTSGARPLKSCSGDQRGISATATMPHGPSVVVTSAKSLSSTTDTAAMLAAWLSPSPSFRKDWLTSTSFTLTPLLTASATSFAPSARNKPVFSLMDRWRSPRILLRSWLVSLVIGEIFMMGKFSTTAVTLRSHVHEPGFHLPARRDALSRARGGCRRPCALYISTIRRAGGKACPRPVGAGRRRRRRGGDYRAQQARVHGILLRLRAPARGACAGQFSPGSRGDLLHPG